MANKTVNKVPFSERRFREALKYRNTNINQFCDPLTGFGRTAKQIYRYIRDSEIPPDVLDMIGKALDVEPDFLSGKYDRGFEKINDPDIVRALKNGLKVQKYPYIRKLQKNEINGKWIEDEYIEKLLIVHGISPKQFEELPKRNQLEFLLDVEEAIAPVIRRHFKLDATGRDSFEEISYLSYRIESALDEFDE